MKKTTKNQAKETSVKKNLLDIKRKTLDAETTRKINESRKLAIAFADELRMFIENKLLKIKPRSPFSKIVQRPRNDVPLYYSGAMWKTYKKLPNLSYFRDTATTNAKVSKNSKVHIGKYMYILFTGTGFRVGFYLDKLLEHTEDSAPSPFNRNKKKLSIKRLLDVIENGARIPLTHKVRAFYFAVMRYYKKRVMSKYRQGKPFWQIPKRPFWDIFVRKFQNRYRNDYEISTNKSLPYSVYIRRLK